eukprot:TRINITY_DN13205_c0_g1_i2.p1 TRINITY_DN13205_c0_g1~~TRINITY_DN13205_c0_g1_i2.p1  ORF type:complete len:156 (-),score=30.78 TRINITY_DN13205_c0_g1_i2:154-621(-)
MGIQQFMKITDDILKALQNCIESFGSKHDFARRANIHINTVSKYLTRKTRSINDDTWERLQPLLRPFLLHRHGSGGEAKERYEKVKKAYNVDFLSSNQKILMDAFSVLPRNLQDQKLIEIVKLAQEQLKNKKQKVYDEKVFFNARSAFAAGGICR